MQPSPRREPPEEELDERFRNRECYEFNPELPSAEDDRWCHHCRKYLTLECKYIDEFLAEDEHEG